MPSLIPARHCRSQEKLKVMVQAQDAARKAAAEKEAAAAKAARDRAREQRRLAVFAAAEKAKPVRTADPFSSPIPPMPGSEAALALEAAAAKGGKGGAAVKKGGSATKPGAKGGAKAGSSVIAKAPALGKGKKQSTKMAALQHNRPGEKPKGLKKWSLELDARGWSEKKTLTSAGFEAWCEFYADAYGGVRLQKQIAPWVWKRNHEIMQDACKWWFVVAKALRERSGAKGGANPAVVAKIIFLGNAALLLRRWRSRSGYAKPPYSRSLPYSRLLKKALDEWKENLQDTTARRKAGIAKLVAQGAAFHARRIALPRAWMSWYALTILSRSLIAARARCCAATHALCHYPCIASVSDTATRSALHSPPKSSTRN